MNKFLLAIALGILLGLTSCRAVSTPTATPAPVATLPPTSPALAASPSAIPATIQPVSLGACDTLTVPDEIVAAGKRTPAIMSQGIGDEPYVSQYGWMSVYLALSSDTWPYNEPISFRVTITNNQDKPMSFVRPSKISMYGDDNQDYPNNPVHLIARLVTASGQLLFNPEQTMIFRNYRPPLPGEFSLLPAASSCTVNLKLIWDQVVKPLPEPIPPGEYQMAVYLDESDFGPRSTTDARELVDIGAWVGRTRFSNTVTFKVLPAQ